MSSKRLLSLSLTLQCHSSSPNLSVKCRFCSFFIFCCYCLQVLPDSAATCNGRIVTLCLTHQTTQESSENIPILTSTGNTLTVGILYTSNAADQEILNLFLLGSSCSGFILLVSNYRTFLVGLTSASIRLKLSRHSTTCDA